MPLYKLTGAALIASVVCTVPALANTILYTGVGTYGGPSVNYSQYEEQEWSQTNSYNFVDISTALFSWTPGQTFDIEAFLTTSVGAGVSSAIASTSFSSSTPDNTPVTYLLFSDLTLPAGTYYLTLASTDNNGNNPGAIWPVECASGCPITEAAGVSLLTAGFANTSSGTQNADFPPASTFVTQSSALNLTITGSASAAGTPEPCSMAMAAAALGALAFLRRRNNRARLFIGS